MIWDKPYSIILLVEDDNLVMEEDIPQYDNIRQLFWESIDA